MYNILFYSGTLQQNGTEMFMMNILRYIDRTCFHIDFCISDTEITPNRVEAESYGCKVYVLPSRRQNPIRSIIAQWNFMRKNAHIYDAIHWNGGNLSSISILLFAKYFNIPIRIVHAHSSNAKGLHNRILHKFHKLFIRSVCNRFFACSTSAAHFFYGNNPAVIINNGIDVDKFGYNPQIKMEIRDKFYIPLTAQVIGHVGQFTDIKNHSFLLDIFSAYHKYNRNSYLLLVGKGPNQEYIQQKTNDLGLKDKVIFTGSRNDVNRLMQAMDCFVMPSLFEGLPFVLVEAQCSGLPCIVSDTINRDIQLTDNVTFLPLQIGAEKWAETIKTQMSAFHRMSQSSTIKKKGFDIKDTVKYLEAIYSGSQL